MLRLLATALGRLIVGEHEYAEAMESLLKKWRNAWEEHYPRSRKYFETTRDLHESTRLLLAFKRQIVECPECVGTGKRTRQFT